VTIAFLSVYAVPTSDKTILDIELDLRLGLLRDRSKTMPETTKTTVNQGDNGQYKVTVPKSLGDALDLDGEEVEWEVHSGSALVMRKADD